MVIGYLINYLRRIAEKLSNKNPIKLRIGGALITLIVVSLSAYVGWLIERLALPNSFLSITLGKMIVVFLMSSALASRSLNNRVKEILNCLKNNTNSKDIYSARLKLKRIVGREVSHLEEEEILRASAETASENSVDGIFAPLFWMFVGVFLWNFSTSLPGPLSLAWAYKASSTIDSMIGYKKGSLKWMGTAGARLDDFLTWIPCRLTLLTLPIISQSWMKVPRTIKAAWRDGSKDLSPNSGLSEAIFAHCAKVQMGGDNIYGNYQLKKPILAKESPKATKEAVQRILKLILELEFTWLISFTFLNQFLLSN